MAYIWHYHIKDGVGPAMVDPVKDCFVKLEKTAHSLPFGFGHHSLPAVHLSVADSIRSNCGIQGFMLRSGVLSSISMPFTIRMFLFLLTNSTIESPIPLGLQGSLDANIPWGSSSRKVDLINSTLPALSNSYRR